MNRIEFHVEPMGDDVKYEGLVIRIDGDDFVDLVRRAELPMATAEGSEGFAGAYQARPAFLLREELLPKQSGARATLLQCECGFEGCWPLVALVILDEETVTWTAFEQPHRSAGFGPRHWDYSGFGPFVFDRRQYEAALAKGTGAGGVAKDKDH